MTPLQAEIIATAHAMADAARAAILPYFRSKALTADNKKEEGFDPVTEADRSAEQAMRDVLFKKRPQDGIVGEEYPPQSGTSGLTWVIDPIDGTRAFISGAPTWGVLIAVNDGGAPLFGMIDQPHTQERFLGGFGLAELQHNTRRQPLLVRCGKSLDQATLLTTFPEVGSTSERAAFERVRDAVRLTRYGLDCYGYMLLALGQVDLVIEAGLAPYDIQAPMAVVEAAGGVVTCWDGGPAHGGGAVIAAATPQLHAAALELLSRH